MNKLPIGEPNCINDDVIELLNNVDDADDTVMLQLP